MIQRTISGPPTPRRPLSDPIKYNFVVLLDDVGSPCLHPLLHSCLLSIDITGARFSNDPIPKYREWDSVSVRRNASVVIQYDAIKINSTNCSRCAETDPQRFPKRPVTMLSQILCQDLYVGDIWYETTAARDGTSTSMYFLWCCTSLFHFSKNPAWNWVMRFEYRI